MKDTLLRTSVIAEQYGGKNVGKANCGNGELAFLASARAKKEGRTSRRRRLQMQLAENNRRRFLNLVSLRLFLIPRGTAHAVPHPVLSCHRFLQDSFILSFTLRNMTRSTPPSCLLFNPLHSHRFQIRNSGYRSGLCTPSKYISYS